MWRLYSGNWLRLWLSIIPTKSLRIMPSCQYQFGISFTPVHSVNSLAMSLVDYHYWALLVSQVPNLQLIFLFIIKSNRNLCWYIFAPTNNDISAHGISSVRTILKLENRALALYIPKSYKTIGTRRCKDMWDLLIPFNWSDIRPFMRIFVSGLQKRWVGNIFSNIHDQNLAGSETQIVWFETVPFGAHNWKSIVFRFFLIK